MRRLATAVVCVTFLAPAPASAAGAHAGAAAQPGMRLVTQTPWVAPGSTFSVKVHVDGVDRPGDLELALTVFQRVPSRSAFALTLQAKGLGSVVGVATAPVGSLDPTGAGDVAVDVPLQDAAQQRDPSKLQLVRDGVYPVAVELRERGGGSVVAGFITHLVNIAAGSVDRRLGVAVVLPMHAPPTLQPGGARQLPPLDGVTAVAQAVDAAPDIPVAVAPTPETAQAVASSPEPANQTLLATMRRSLEHRAVPTEPYVPVDVPGLLDADLDHEVDEQVARGRDTTTQALRANPDGGLWVAEAPLDEPSLARLRDAGIDRVVLPEQALEPVNQSVTLTRPFVLEGREGVYQEAAAADPGLAGHFGDGDPVLEAHQLLADLAVLYLDQPGTPGRGVVALAPRAWTPTRAFLDALFGGLRSSPAIEPVDLATLFGLLPQSQALQDARIVRRSPTPGAAALAEAAPGIRAARRRIGGVGSLFDRAGTPIAPDLNQRLLVTESADLRPRARQTYLDGVDQSINGELQRIQISSGRSITLTARQGQIPVTFRNLTGYPARAIVHLQSDKLGFPTPPTRGLDLTRANTTERFSVIARTPGTFPLHLVLESPDGALVIGRARFTVRSTAASGVGIVLSVGAALFLAAWWARHLFSGRRARELVPA